MEQNLSPQFKYTWGPKNKNVRAFDKTTGQPAGHINMSTNSYTGETKTFHVETYEGYRGQGVATGMYGKFHEKNPDAVVTHHEEDMSSHAKRLYPRLEQEYPGKHKFVSRAEDDARRRPR